MEKRIEIQGLNINYYDASQGDKTLLFLHGNSLGAKTYIKQLDSELLRKNYRLIAVDFPGYGGSDFAPNKKESYSFRGFARFLIDFTNALQLDDVVYVGHSAGGNYTLESHNELPNMSGIVLAGTTIDGKKPVETPTIHEHSDLPLLFKSQLSGDEAKIIAAMFFKKGSEVPDFVVDLILDCDPETRPNIISSAMNGEFDDEVEIVTQLSTPVAIFHGEHDQVVNFDYYATLTIPELWRNQVQVIPGSGHMMQWENAPVFNQLLLEFADSL